MSSSLSGRILVAIGCRGVIEGRVASTIEILTERGFTVLQEDQRVLSSSEASLLSRPSLGSDAFVGSPVVLLLLERPDCYAQFNAIRSQFDWTYGSESSWVALRDEASFFPSSAKFERAVILVKPDAPASATETLKKTLEQHDFLIVARSVLHLNEDGAGVFCGEDAFLAAEERKYLSSGDSTALVVERFNAIQLLMLLAGPVDPIEARDVATITPCEPYNTLRSRFGASLVRNFIWISPSVEDSQRILKLIFRNPFPLENCFALVEPPLVSQMAKIEESLALHGFTIVGQSEIYFSKGRAELFTQDSLATRYGKQNIAALTEAAVRRLTSGPSVALILSKPAAIDGWRILTGPLDFRAAREQKPASLRGQFAAILEELENDHPEWNEFDRALNTGFYGSPSADVASKEVKSFFPLYASNYDQVPEMPQLRDFLHAKQEKSIGIGSSVSSGNPHNKSLYEVLVDGLTQLCRVKPQGEDAIIWLADWLERNNPNRPRVEIPAEPIEEESKQNGSGELKKIVWLCGLPYTSKKRVAQQLRSLAPSYEHIDLGVLLNFHTETNTEFGQIIARHRAAFRPVPSSVTVALLAQAVKNVKSQNLIISNVPQSLDEAFQLEKALGRTPDAVIAFSAQSGGAWIPERSGGKVSLKQVKSLEEDLEPVLEHYSRFKKVHSFTVNEETDAEELAQEVKRIL